MDKNIILFKDEEENCCYDELTPDSGCFSIKSGLNTTNNNSFYSTINSPSTNKEEDFPIDLDGSYIKYINTFAIQNDSLIINETNILNENSLVSVNSNLNSSCNNNNNSKIVIPCKNILANLNTYELNDLIEQIESTTKELSDILVHELDVKDELEFEKETKNTFISLLMSIQENNHTGKQIVVVSKD